MENNKYYRFLVNLDPQNPIDKRGIDTINQIRNLYKINKRQTLMRLLSLYQYFVNSGVKDPFGISENGVVDENQLKAKQKAIAVLASINGLEKIMKGQEIKSEDVSSSSLDLDEIDEMLSIDDINQNQNFLFEPEIPLPDDIEK